MFAFLAQTWAIRRSSASRASLLLGTEPVWAVAVGVGLGGESLTPVVAVGAAVVVGATLWAQSVERRAPVVPLPSVRAAAGGSATRTARRAG
ncbi:hypothetical protein GCM10025868_00780 [Angustibacter aerolatus]|uniref:EamA domain-containing protein n=1 Tax=Angustibacter aerolatus TaxID=1162965 RepID=A0ABQ6JBI8_9ACTN|nr:hypothetical protein GCM10025868_00780 [Angustibacter aerolatus]